MSIPMCFLRQTTVCIFKQTGEGMVQKARSCILSAGQSGSSLPAIPNKFAVEPPGRKLPSAPPPEVDAAETQFPGASSLISKAASRCREGIFRRSGFSARREIPEQAAQSCILSAGNHPPPGLRERAATFKQVFYRKAVSAKLFVPPESAKNFILGLALNRVFIVQ